MIIGVPREIKADERRVGLLPVGARALVQAGHEVRVERGAGAGAGADDGDYEAAGATLVDSPAAVYGESATIVKVKEPQASEFPLIRSDHVLFTYFHFAASEPLTRSFLETGATAIAYETVEDDEGHLPLLVPMSEVAGRMAIQQGAKYLEGPHGGRGVLLGGVPGVAPADVVILGAGVVGFNAARVAAGMGANVHLLDISVKHLRQAELVLPANVHTYVSNSYNLEKLVNSADLLIGAVLVPGARAPKLVTRSMLAGMKRGAVIVDVAVDQGGCVETVHPTTHHDPIYIVDGIVHCGIANLPGAVPRTSTMALTNATLPYVLAIAGRGWRQACRADEALFRGVNAVSGQVTYRAVAEAMGLEWHPLDLSAA
ncbi:MAG: alanine dehydrogenase [Gemmatimonadota bacterium]